MRTTTLRVDNVPFYLKPFFLLYAYLVGSLVYAGCFLLHYLCRIRFEGKEHLQGRSNFIFCLWHNNVFPYFIAFPHHDAPHIWMNHPAWTMKPIHVIIRLSGVKGLVLGSAGQEGQEAVAKLVQYLRQGYSTMVLPDGPAGPPKVLKKGVLHMAMQSGVPIIPMRIVTPHRILLKKTWEGKRCPFPFSLVRVIYEKPIQVTEENFNDSAERLAVALG